MTDELQDPLKTLAEICEPDIRHAHFRNAHFAFSLADTHAELADIVLHEHVPLDVRQLFETAKNASLYSWFVYRFHQVSEMVAFSSLEWALRVRAGFPAFDDSDSLRPPSLAKLLDTAKREGWITTEGFPSLREAAIQRARSRHTFHILHSLGDNESRELPEPTEAEIAEAMKDIDLVTSLAATVPKLRNRLAHGSPVLNPNSRRTLRTIAEVINQLFVAPL